MVRQSVDTGRNLPHHGLAVGEKEYAVDTADQQIESVVARREPCDLIEIFARFALRNEKVADQLTARGSIGLARARIAKIGKRGKTAATRHTQPGAHAFQVASGKDVRMILPECRFRRGPLVVLIAVGCDHQRIIGVRAMREQDQAHRGGLRIAGRAGARGSVPALQWT